MPEVRRTTATAGEVRRDGAASMEVASADVRFTRWGRPVAGVFLLAGVLVPHLLPAAQSAYAFGFAASLVALEYVWTHVARGVRAESLAWGLVFGLLFFGVVDGAGLPNSVAGPILLALAVLASVHTFRAYPSYAEPPSAETRISGFLILAAALWATIMLVRTLQAWPPW